MKINIDDVKGSYNASEIVKGYLDKQEKMGLSLSEWHLIKKYGKRGDRFIDIGCGTGRVSIALASNNYSNILGIDLSDTMISVAKKQVSKLSKVKFKSIDIVEAMQAIKNLILH